MRHRVFHHGESQDVFTDLLFNALLGFAFMFITAFAMINETSATGKVESKAEVLVTVRWADDHPDDGGKGEQQRQELGRRQRLGDGPAEVLEPRQ